MSYLFGWVIAIDINLFIWGIFTDLHSGPWFLLFGKQIYHNFVFGKQIYSKFTTRGSIYNGFKIACPFTNLDHKHQLTGLYITQVLSNAFHNITENMNNFIDTFVCSGGFVLHYIADKWIMLGISKFLATCMHSIPCCIIKIYWFPCIWSHYICCWLSFGMKNFQNSSLVLKCNLSFFSALGHIADS